MWTRSSIKLYYHLLIIPRLTFSLKAMLITTINGQTKFDQA